MTLVTTIPTDVLNLVWDFAPFTEQVSLQDPDEVPAIDLVEQTIPQKGTTLEVPDKVLVGVVPKENAAQYEDRTSIEYHTGRKVPQTIPLNDIDWFVPYISGNGARDLYRVKRVHTGLKGDSTPDDNLRIILDIEYVQPLYPDYKQFPSGYLVGEVFKHTTIGELYNM